MFRLFKSSAVSNLPPTLQEKEEVYPANQFHDADLYPEFYHIVLDSLFYSLRFITYTIFFSVRIYTSVRPMANFVRISKWFGELK